VFLTSVGLLIVGLALALSLKNIPLRSDGGHRAPTHDEPEAT
jgi:hypothetical protein